MSREHPINRAMKQPAVRAYLNQIFALSPVAKTTCRKMAQVHAKDGKGDLFNQSLEHACETWGKEFGNKMMTINMALRHERVFFEALEHAFSTKGSC